VELTGYLAVAKRWWWTLLVATWVAGVAGYVVASQIPPTYEAETQLLVGPYNTDRETLAAAGDLVQTYSQLVTTTPLLESAIREARVDLTPAELALASRVTANDVTRFLTIRVQNTDPELAARLANNLADEITQLASRGTNRPEGQLQIVDRAVPPAEPIAPQRSLIVGLAALAALIGAMVLVMLLEYLSAAVRSEDELHRLTGLPLLGNVDVARSLPQGDRSLIDQAPESAAAAAYRLVLAKAAFQEGGSPARSIVVVGTGPDGASSQVAANLAAITARSGRQVVLVDAEHSDLSATRIFRLDDRGGVTDLVDASPADVTSRLVRVSGALRVLPHGIARNPDAIDADRASAVISALLEDAELVIVNAGVLHQSAGALAWAQAADTAILVAVRDQARRDDVEYAADSLRLVGVETAGTVLAERKRGIRRGRSRGGPEQPIPTSPPPRPPRPLRETSQVTEARPTPLPPPVLEPVPESPYRASSEPVYRIEPEYLVEPEYRSEPEPLEADPIPPAPNPTRRSPRRRGSTRRTT
jgi:capsular polysaccharide biosynthesis protein/Mrp family chromosome partitioning ATPase